MLKDFIQIIFVMVVSVFIVSCKPSDSLGDVKKFVADLKLQQTIAVERLPDFITNLENSFVLIGEKNSLSDASKERWVFPGYAIENITFVGYLKNSKMIWGIIKAENNSFEIVKKSDFIGRQKLEVIKVDENEITLSKNQKIEFSSK